ncbi:MAG: hypothetical protein H6590_06100 [Flavobacteriales bacterium]|nr:hypothetical protein [Flavobacteriales bacterium]
MKQHTLLSLAAAQALSLQNVAFYESISGTMEDARIAEADFATAALRLAKVAEARAMRMQLSSAFLEEWIQQRPGGPEDEKLLRAMLKSAQLQEVR